MLAVSGFWRTSSTKDAEKSTGRGFRRMSSTKRAETKRAARHSVDVDLHSAVRPAQFASFVARVHTSTFHYLRPRATAVGEAGRPS